MDGVTVLIILGVLFVIGRGLVPNPFSVSSNVNQPSTQGQFTNYNTVPTVNDSLPAISQQNQTAGPVLKSPPWSVGCGLPSPSLPMNPVAMSSSIPSRSGAVVASSGSGQNPTSQRVTFTTI